jgi:hypothetical protein
MKNCRAQPRPPAAWTQKWIEGLSLETLKHYVQLCDERLQDDGVGYQRSRCRRLRAELERRQLASKTPKKPETER